MYKRARSVQAIVLRRLILRGLHRVISFTSRHGSSFMGVIVSTSVHRHGQNLSGQGGALTSTRGQVTRLSAVFGQLCRSAVSKGLSSRHFRGLSASCRGRRRRLRSMTVTLQSRVRMRRHGDTGIREFLSIMRQCARVPRLAPYVLRRFVRGVIIRTTDSPGNGGHARRVSVCCGNVKTLRMSGIASSEWR